MSEYQLIGAGLAAIGTGAAAIGVGIIFGNFVNGALRNPSAASSQFTNAIIGAALAEGLVFAQKLGLDPRAFLKVARESAAQSQVMDIKGPKMVSGDYTPHGFITQTRKDFLLMLEQAGARGQGLPLAETYVSIVNGCVAAGEGEFDNSAVIEEIRRRKPKTA